MTISRPTGGRRGDMTAPPSAWPMTDEDRLQQRATALQSKRDQLLEVLETWRRVKRFIFNSQGWIGDAAGIAEKTIDRKVADMEDLDHQLQQAIDFYKAAFDRTVTAKNEIIDVSDEAQQRIDERVAESDQDGKDRSGEIQAIVDKAYSDNSQIVSAAGKALGGPAPLGSPADSDNPSHFLTSSTLSDEGSRDGAPTQPEGAPGGKEANKVQFDDDKDRPAETSDPPGPTTGQPPIAPTAFGGDTHNPVDGETSTATPPTTPSQPADPATVHTPALPVDRSSPSTPSSPAPPGIGNSLGKGGIDGGGPTGGGSGWGDKSSSSGKVGDSAGKGLDGLKQDDKAKVSTGDGRPLTPAELQQKMLTEMTQGLATGAQQVPVQPLASAAGLGPPPTQPHVPVDATPPPTTASAPPVAPHLPPAASGGGGGFSGGGAPPVSGPSGSFAPPPMPLGPPATPPIATPPGGGGGGSGGGPGGGSGGGPGTNAASGNSQSGPNVNAASTAGGSAAAAVPAPVPVSAARLERDAVASASAAGAARRSKNGGKDPLTYARRVAAALNVGVADFGFFWVTGVCADGTIIVANSYGLGYIPDGVNLPPQIRLATADESIPLSERAKWATYPVLALQGWAQAHSQKLRAVIATEAQFTNFDPGTAKVVLQPDDIPTTGTMEGRSRLEVIAPEAASRLASISDAGLTELLPPAPADLDAPDDNTIMLWFDVAKPLMSTMSDRGIAHLESFIVYADHAQELALYRAHTAADAATQRQAIADWVYWQHLSVMISDAIAADVAV